ncbi:hypothetical protein LP422_23995 [Janibacter limosus]|nr:hypothetical protein [Janibacter limosus]WKV15833.1 hypothetical protein LP422_23995 [Janibacter limosus]
MRTPRAHDLKEMRTPGRTTLRRCAPRAHVRRTTLRRCAPPGARP